MMEMIILKPKINSKFHFGEGSLEGSNYIFHSNSLFSAIANNYIKIYGEDEDFEKIKNIGLSSLFLKVDDIYLIPKPEHPRFYILKNKVEGVRPKDIKKIQFFSIKAYKELLEGILNWNENRLKEIIDNQVINKTILVSNEEVKKLKNIFEVGNKKLISRVIEQKVAIDRLKNTTLEKDGRGQLYNIEFIKLHPKAEFYFLIDYNSDDSEFIKKVKASIKLIEDEGLGGKRSIGAGFFENVEFLDIPKDFKGLFKKDEEYSMLLGVGIPKNGDIKKIEYYKLIEIGGYIYHPKCLTKPKRNVLALAEGSIVKKEFEGDIKDITPENYKINKVYAHGRPILLPFNLKGDENESKM